MCRWTGIAEGGRGAVAKSSSISEARRPTDRCWYRRVLLRLLVVASFMHGLVNQLNGAAGLGSPKARRWRLSGAIFQITNCNCFFFKKCLNDKRARGPSAAGSCLLGALVAVLVRRRWPPVPRWRRSGTLTLVGSPHHLAWHTAMAEKRLNVSRSRLRRPVGAHGQSLSRFAAAAAALLLG
jgi:hypothetical protein